MKITIACDHVALGLKRVVIDHLTAQEHELIDCGTHTSARCDYPVYGKAVARLVASGEAERGIVICGTGVGISIAANKVRGVRAVVCSEPYSAKLSREHNDTNVLAFGCRVVGRDLSLMIVDAWLNAPFEGGRHAARVAMLEDQTPCES